MKFENQHQLTLISLKIIAAAILLAGYARFIDGTYTRKIISYKNQYKIQTVKSVYAPGEMIQGYVSFCKYRDVTPHITDSLVDDYLHTTPEYFSTYGSTGCRDNLIVNFQIVPPELPSGTYHFIRKLEYESNPLKTVTETLITVDFKVN